MYIYGQGTTEFNNNGYGILRDTIDAKVTEVLNGEMSISIEYPLQGLLAEYILEENIIKADVGGGSFQLFRIKHIEKTSTRIKAYGVHIFYDLIDNMLEDVAPTDLNCQAALEWILDRTSFANNYTAFSDIATTASARYVRLNPVEAIISADNSLVAKYGAELERDNFTIKLLGRRGADNKVKLLFGKNIKEINITTDSTTIATRIMPIGYDGLLLPDLYVDSPKILDYPTPKIAKVEFGQVKYDPNDPDAFHTIEEAYDELIRLTEILYSDFNIDSPAISVKVDWVELSKVKEYYDQYAALETVHLGDTITAEIYGLNYQTRCIKTIYNVLSDRVEVFEIGTFKPTFTESTTLEIQALAAAVAEVSPASILTEAQDKATALITQAMGGYVYKTQSELFIMDTDDLETAQKVWRWNIAGLGYSSTGINGQYGIAITNDGQIVADFITAGSLNVNKVQGLQDSLSNLQGQITLNGDTIQLTISDVNNIKENGVSRLSNALVTIDSNGINVSKTGEQITSLMTNEGFYVYRDKGFASEVQMLKVNSTGVVAENITVRKYFVIGNNSRMEDYETGTGVFYIGS